MLLLALVLATTPTDPLEAAERHQQALFERIAPSVVFLSTGKSLGSGVVVGKGQVLTNAHVVGTQPTVEVVLHDGRKGLGRVVERAAGDIDLALVAIPFGDVRPVELAFDSNLRVGSWVAAIGHGEGSVWSFNVGMVSNLYDGKSSREVFQTQIPLNPGNSGGPIFDRRGVVVGIVTAGISRANNINFGIDMAVAFRALEELRRASEVSLSIRAPAGVPVFLAGKNVGMGPLVVVARLAAPTEAFAVIDGAMVRVPVTPADREVTLGAPR
ncbi:MAG: trypsin-like peptidase domain-containing protein [Myxococcaceae bacterium]|jgi:serine protease Do|nr:trypsin-like peptidase domain-containing protein [Myxococcaceae bacterium]MCA3011978.1 trypsin-like peptidase domain-containing protein [Myxococcaceae bacterium]